VNGSC
ncbi:TRAP transporter, 4TM/12TM fusion family protein, partial [Vibrio parahaemolyticus V-223/04]